MMEEGKLKVHLKIKGVNPASQAERRLLLFSVHLLAYFCRGFWKYHIPTNGSGST